MRILVVTNMLPRPDDPSYGVFVAEQLRALKDAGLDAELYFIEGYKTRWAYPQAICDLRTKRGYDVYHAHHAYAAVACRLAGLKPLVLTVHEGAVTRGGRYRAFVKTVARGVARRVAVSPALARALAPLPCDVIPIGVDMDLFRPRDRFDARFELGLAPGKKYILFAANPARPEKRFDLAREAVDVLRREDEAVELISLPPSSRGRVAAYYGAADVVLVTSDYESGPLTVKEAVASERPVVSRQVGDVDFLDHCPACVITGGTPAEIAAAVKRAFALTTVSRDVVAPYELGATTRRLTALYGEVVRDGRA